MDIFIRGASQNTLQHIDLTLPVGKITVLVGPSGSGKSTLARDTLFAESRRRFLDCLSAGAQRMLARPKRPQVDSIEGLPPALCLEQGVPHASSRAVLGGITEALDYLRVIYAAIGCPHDPVTGERLKRMSVDEIELALMELGEGTRLTLLAPLSGGAPGGEQSEHTILSLRKAGYLRLRVNGRLAELDDLEKETLEPTAQCELVIDRLILKQSSASRLADSLQNALRFSPHEIRVLVQKEGEEEPQLFSYYTSFRNERTGFSLPDLSPELFSPFSPSGACEKCEGRGRIEEKKGVWETCPACNGMQLNPVALAVTLPFGEKELSLGNFCRLTVAQNMELLEHLDLPTAYCEALRPACDALRTRLHYLEELSLSYLSLSRPAFTLSGGELQRARLAGQLGGGLSGVLYILDEPTIGLHATETARLISVLKRLRDRGNTILVVEHDADVIRSADWVVEMGPGSGEKGGRILTTGTPSQIAVDPNSPTGAWLSGRRHFARTQPLDAKSLHWAILHHVSARNLKGFDFRFPLQAFTCISGPGGSGKSTLVHECLLPALKAGNLTGAASISRAVVVDQSPLGVSPRSTPASASGLLDVLRPLYAKLPLSRTRGYTPARFALGVRGGRCERCAGTGFLQVDMNFLSDLLIPCDACKGARYNRETLEVTWRGRSIAQILNLTVDEAREFLESIPAAAAILSAMQQVGLGYLQLSRASSSLSGGEAQRIRIASHLAKATPRQARSVGREKLLIVLDEPTTGLHFNEIDMLLRAIYRLRDAGHTILCVEHHAGVLACADFLVELGPGSGDAGGELICALLRS